jgi:hypothetical protein
MAEKIDELKAQLAELAVDELLTLMEHITAELRQRLTKNVNTFANLAEQLELGDRVEVLGSYPTKDPNQPKIGKVTGTVVEVGVNLPLPTSANRETYYKVALDQSENGIFYSIGTTTRFRKLSDEEAASYSKEKPVENFKLAELVMYPSEPTDRNDKGSVEQLEPDKPSNDSTHLDKLE